MKTPEEIYEILKSEFPDAVLNFENDLPVESYIIIDPLKVHIVSKYLRDTDGLKFDSLMVLSGVDENDGEKIKNEDGTETVTGGNLSVYYHLDSTALHQKVNLKVVVQKKKPEVESVEKVWRTADWHEREAYDMYGIIFLNHPDLRRILMPYDWDEESFPLRKDYENPEFYNGMRVPY